MMTPTDGVFQLLKRTRFRSQNSDSEVRTRDVADARTRLPVSHQDPHPVDVVQAFCSRSAILWSSLPRHVRGDVEVTLFAQYACL